MKQTKNIEKKFKLLFGQTNWNGLEESRNNFVSKAAVRCWFCAFACSIATFNIWYRFLLWSCTLNQIRLYFFPTHLFAQSIHKWDIFLVIANNSQIEHTHRIERMYFVSVSPRKNTREPRFILSFVDDKRTTKFRLTRAQNWQKFRFFRWIIFLFVW